MIILLILQNESVNKRASQVLLNAGYQVISTRNSADALSILKVEPVDLVITEIDIGSIDGWRLSRLLRAGVLASKVDVPIVLVTENYSERIAETTAAMFDICRVVAYQELELLSTIIPQVVAGEGNLNTTKNILVIEDNEDNANLVVRMLKHKFAIDVTVDGPSGIEAFKNKNYDIVLLDIMMPGMSGDKVLDVLLEIKPSQTVIAMTAHGTIDIAEVLLEKGATDYLQKPFKAEQLRKLCDIAEKREDFLVANEQFSSKALALSKEQKRYNSLSKDHYRILDSLHSIVIELTPAGRISFINNAWFKLSQFLVSETLGKYFTDYIADQSSQGIAYVQDSYNALIEGRSTQESLEVQLKKQNGQLYWASVNLAVHKGENDQIIGMSGVIDDISSRKKAEARLKHVALHDTLTGIHNRYYFDNELKNFAETAKSCNEVHSLLYLDLDHFKVINDSQGHHQGDLVLKEVARILSGLSKDTDTLCRIGGDEFALILTNTTSVDAKVLANDITQVVAESSFRFDEQVYKVSCSIGIAEIDGSALSSDLYLQQADIAMYVAKDKGRNRVHIFSEQDKSTEQLKQSFEWAQKLQKSISEDGVVLHFQPIIDVASRKTECYEALVRLHIDGKLIFPNDFIPYLEKAEDMSLLDRHVIDKACKLMHQHSVLEKVAINLSAQAFTDDRLFYYIADKLKQYQIAPSRVIFELTESASLANVSATQRMVSRLNEHGCHFSIDDFGTGFSTFAYLKQIPADSVKIDGSFVKDMLDNPIDAVLVKSIHETAQALGKKSIAEFVENEATLIRLAALGINYAQGYHIGKPMPIEAIIEQLTTLYAEGGSVA